MAKSQGLESAHFDTGEAAQHEPEPVSPNTWEAEQQEPQPIQSNAGTIETQEPEQIHQDAGEQVVIPQESESEIATVKVQRPNTTGRKRSKFSRSSTEGQVDATKDAPDTL